MTATAFDDLDDYLALPRISGLAVSADGTRVVTTVAELNEKRTEHISAVWEIDPTGERPARRLTRSANGDSVTGFHYRRRSAVRLVAAIRRERR